MSGHRLVDHNDRPEALVQPKRWAIGTSVVCALGPLFSLLHGEYVATVAWLMVVGPIPLMAWGLYWILGRDQHFASPGELLVTPWPAKAGQPMTLRFRRRIRKGGTPGDVQARLMLRYNNGSGESTYPENHLLEPVEGETVRGALEAAWTFEAPPPAGDCEVPVTRGRPYYGHYTWQLEIQVPLARGPKLDSTFNLEIEP